MEPEAWVLQFEQAIAAGDLAAALALYESDACVRGPDGVLQVGRAAIERTLAKLIARGAQLHGTVVRTLTAGDLALLYTDWNGSIASRAVEILRRQPDGTWKLVIGDPTARDR
jgi:ketosteroid isomerase-like protein